MSDYDRRSLITEESLSGRVARVAHTVKVLHYESAVSEDMRMMQYKGGLKIIAPSTLSSPQFLLPSLLLNSFYPLLSSIPSTIPSPLITPTLSSLPSHPLLSYPPISDLTPSTHSPHFSCCPAQCSAPRPLPGPPSPRPLNARPWGKKNKER